jgi:hypothetical protein
MEQPVKSKQTVIADALCGLPMLKTERHHVCSQGARSAHERVIAEHVDPRLVTSQCVLEPTCIANAFLGPTTTRVMPSGRTLTVIPEHTRVSRLKSPESTWQYAPAGMPV